MLDIVMHNVIIFILVNPPLSACERRSCLSRLSDWLHTGSIQFDKSGRKRKWRRYANGKTLEQNASIEYTLDKSACLQICGRCILCVVLHAYRFTYVMIIIIVVVVVVVIITSSSSPSSSSSSSPSSSSMGSCSVPWLGEGLSIPWLGNGLSMPSPSVLCCPLPDRVAPVFVQIVSPSLGWCPVTYFLVVCLQVVTCEVHLSSYFS